MATQGFNIRFNGIIGFAFMVLLFVGLFFIAKGVFTVLAWIAPVLIILALLINYRTVLNYLKFMLGLLQRNPVGGIIGILLSFQAEKDGEFVEFEEIIKSERETKLDLPPMEKQAPVKKDNQYEDLF